jgi:GNAT superfamily N-acetyltransferase
VITFDIGPFQPALEEPFARLFKQEGFERPPAYLRWMFAARPNPAMVAVARDTEANDEVVGLLALVQSHLWCKGAVIKAHMAIDLVVDASYRGRGIFRGLGKIALEASERSGAKLVWGFPNKSAASTWFNRFSWTNMGPVPLMVRPLRTGFALGRLAGPLRRLDVRLIRRKGELKGLFEIRRLGAEANQLWSGFAKRVGCCVVRDAAWLNWRLFGGPQSAYRTVSITDESGDLRVLVSSKVERKLGCNLLFVVEAMSASKVDDPALAKLIAHELALAAANGVDAALCWSRAGSPNYGVFRRAGFWSLPAKLRPSSSFFGVRDFGDAPTQVKSGDWYISFLDLETI